MEEGNGEVSNSVATGRVATASSPSQKEERIVLVRDAGGGVATHRATQGM